MLSVLTKLKSQLYVYNLPYQGFSNDDDHVKKHMVLYIYLQSLVRICCSLPLSKTSLVGI